MRWRAYRAHVDRGMENLIRLFRDALGTDRRPRRDRAPSRAAAPGTDADRHPPRVFGKSDGAGLRSGVPLAARRRCRASARLPKASTPSGTRGDGFCFDNETPAHRALVGPVRIARALVTNGEWLAFMGDGGYARPDLWLSDGWATVCAEGWRAPGHWREIDGAWHCFTLGGLRTDRGSRAGLPRQLLRGRRLRPLGRQAPAERGGVGGRGARRRARRRLRHRLAMDAQRLFSLSRLPAGEGAVGEYNGKFMVNQMVLRGASLATPAGHARASYRNFFPPRRAGSSAACASPTFRPDAPVLAPSEKAS